MTIKHLLSNLKFHTFTIFSILILCLQLFLSTSSNSQNNRQIGINLGFITDWSQQWMFVDAMKQSRPWIVQEPGFGTTHWDWEVSGIKIPKRSDGYPTHIPFIINDTSYQVHTLLLRDLKHPAPTGLYSLVFEGKGSIQLNFDAENRIYTTPDSLHNFLVTPSMGGIHLTILLSDTNDPIHNIRVIMPGFVNTYQTQPFHPKFLELLRNFSVVRFLAPQDVNYIEIISPSERTPLNYYTQVRDGNNGLAYEYIIKLCNELNSDPWICIPHRANNAFVSEVAQLFRDNLEADRKVYFEYSNEVWSIGYPYSIANQYAQTQGTSLGLSGNSYDAGLMYYTLRSLEIFNIFDSVYSGSTSRLVKVLSSQTYLRTGEIILGALKNPVINPKNISADGFAIGAYFGYQIADNIADAGLINSVSVSDIVDSLEIMMPPYINTMVTSFKALADSFNLPLIAYEGGQHLTANAYQNDTMLVRKLTEANRDPRMKNIYCDFYDIWYNAGGGVFNAFVFVDNYNRYGSFGLLEYLYQDIQTAPKWMAHKECVFDTTTVDIKYHFPISSDYTIYPNPCTKTITITNSVPEKKSIIITDITGRLVFKTAINNSFVNISTSGFNKGMFFYQILNNERKTIQKGKFLVN